VHESSGKEISQEGQVLAETRMSPAFLAERADAGSPGAGRTNEEAWEEL
jgi:hypothetical protein